MRISFFMRIKAEYWADLEGEDYQQYIIPCIQNNTPGGTSILTKQKNTIHLKDTNILLSMYE